MCKIVKRAHFKHHWIMGILYGNEKVNYPKELKDWNNHPVRLINEAMKEKKREKMTRGSVSLLNGLILPEFAFLLLFITSIYFGIITIIENSNNPGCKTEVQHIDSKDSITTFKGTKYFLDEKDFVVVSDSLQIYKIKDVNKK